MSVKLRREVFNASNDYAEHLKSDYVKSTKADVLFDDLMIKDFANSLVFKKAKDYSRVFVRGAVHSFIVMENRGKLKRGDILRPITRTKPDTSFVHGNVLEKKYEKISWSGV